MTEDEQHRLHQQRPKYIKSIYHLASCLLALAQPEKSHSLLVQLFEEDAASNYMHPLFKHFAAGKVLYALKRYREATDHLETAIHHAERGQETDFVHELAARCELVLKNPDRALQRIGRIEPHRRRPYVLWTEADAMVALGRVDKSIALLKRCAERDKRSRHIALIRICRIHLQRANLQSALQSAREAVSFCLDTYGNPSHEARFWEAVSLHRLGRNHEALTLIEELEECRFAEPNLHRLAALVRTAQEGSNDVKPDQTQEKRRVTTSLAKVK